MKIPKKERGMFETAVREQPEVMEYYLMTGESDHLVRVLVPDVETLEHFIIHELTRISGIANIWSSVALK